MPDEDLTYPYAVTMDEVLEIAIEHMDKVLNTSDRLKQGVHLKMAAKALECALRIYKDQISNKESP
jgi:uncharacterized protein (DUF488 family)